MRRSTQTKRMMTRMTTSSHGTSTATFVKMEETLCAVRIAHKWLTTDVQVSNQRQRETGGARIVVRRN